MAEGDPDLESIRDSITPLPPVEPAAKPPPPAWQPLTPRGVAAFSSGSNTRLLLAQLFVALLVVLACHWFLAIAWLPVFQGALRELPEQGYIRNAELFSPRTIPAPLAAGRHLAFGIDLDQRSNASVGADLYLKFHRREALLCSKLGCLHLPYPDGWLIQFNRTELVPWWGAWKTPVLILVSLVLLLLLFALWTLLALVGAPVCWLAARARGRAIDLAAAWRVAAASQLPGALWLAASLLFYAAEAVGAGVFCVLAALSLVVPWVYLFLAAPHVLPRPSVAAARAVAANPFRGASPDAGPEAGKEPKKANVFRPED